MKKFISMVMAAAMVVSLVPATAFAKTGDVTATAKVVDAAELTKDEAKVPIVQKDAPELQIKIKDVDYQRTNIDTAPTAEVTITLDNAKFYDEDKQAVPNLKNLVNIKYDDGKCDEGDAVVKDVKDVDEDEMTIVFEGEFDKDDIIYIDLASFLTKTSNGTKATVSVDSDDLNLTVDDLVYATVIEKAIKASIKKTVDVAEEEKTELYEKGLKVEVAVGDDFGALLRNVKNPELTLKLNKGFEFAKDTFTVSYDKGNGQKHVFTDGDGYATVDDNEITLAMGDWEQGASELVFTGLWIEATTAKAGDVATITVGVSSMDKVKVEVAKVVDYKVALTVDEDEDVPVIYSGVDVDNTGITDDSDHMSLIVTAEETFPGAWSMRKGFSFELPEGVYVTDVKNVDAENFQVDDNKDTDATKAWEKAFGDAYQEGDHLNFEFAKRTFDDVDVTLTTDPAKVEFQLELVADPTFEGDVVLKLVGDLVDEQEVTIAKFVKPYTVKAEQNDLKIDYRYTEVPTAIVITEAEAGLWDKNAEFRFSIDDNDSGLISFEDDATFEIDKDSELEIKDDVTSKGNLEFTVKAISDEAATVTIKDMTLFMQRNIPAGPYDLSIASSLATAYENQMLFAPDEKNCTLKNHDDDKECYVGDVCDYSDVVKEAFVNIITAGREVDDASFTTKVVVPVGESYIISGENQITLDVPAYINAAGYTMLPVRAVAVALGINTNNVLWDQATKTVTILYGQRIITMVAGQKVVYVNGSAIPASASVEIVKGRTFLPMRDLATALGVTDITWDAATKTATLNGNQK